MEEPHVFRQSPPVVEPVHVISIVRSRLPAEGTQDGLGLKQVAAARSTEQLEKVGAGGEPPLGKPGAKGCGLDGSSPFEEVGSLGHVLKYLTMSLHRISYARYQMLAGRQPARDSAQRWPPLDAWRHASGRGDPSLRSRRARRCPRRRDDFDRLTTHDLAGWVTPRDARVVGAGRPLSPARRQPTLPSLIFDKNASSRRSWCHQCVQP